MQPIKPMLASPPKAPIETVGVGWVADTKLDGIRVIAYVESNNVTLVNRSMRDVTHRFPEVVASLEALGSDVVLDGEIVAESGSFQDTARRDKQNKPFDVARHLKDYPVQFVAFDCISALGQDLTRHPWTHRRAQLDQLSLLALPHLNTSVFDFDILGFAAKTRALGMEGVIVKRQASPYRSGRFSDWTKYKNLHSITCIATGYDLGEGARQHFGAMHLTMLDAANKPVRVGVVGTGFTQSEIASLKATLDGGKPVVVEIEVLNVTKDGALRFPVYKGMRTDLSVLAATMSQLDDIPRT